MQQHVESLLKVVGKTQVSGGPVSGVASTQGDKEVKLARLSETDDVEAYLTTFKWTMATFKVPKAQ